MNGFVFDKGIDITPVQSLMGFTYGAGVLVGGRDSPAGRYTG